MVGKPEERNHLEDQCVDVKMKLETEYDVVRTGFIWLITGALLITLMTSRFP